MLGIRSLQDLELHFAKGQLFENFILLEKIKRCWNYNTHEKFFFWRDSTGNEVDLLIERGQELLAVEIKSGKTINTEFFKNLHHFKKIKADASCFLVYGGNEVQKRSDSTVLGSNQLDLI